MQESQASSNNSINNNQEHSQFSSSNSSNMLTSDVSSIFLNSVIWMPISLMIDTLLSPHKSRFIISNNSCIVKGWHILMCLNIILWRHRARVQVLVLPTTQVGFPVLHLKVLTSSLTGFKNFTISRSVPAQERTKNLPITIRISHSGQLRLLIMDLKRWPLSKLKMRVFLLLCKPIMGIRKFPKPSNPIRARHSKLKIKLLLQLQ
jgi:hypothetical protein